MSAEAVQDFPDARLASDVAVETAPIALPDDAETFEELYEEAPVAYFSTTADDVITRVNGTLLAWTGYREADLLGKRFTDLLDPGTQLFYETRHVPVLRLEGEIREVALRVVRADGTTLPVLLNSVMVPGPDGRPRSIRTAMFDATDRNQYERDLLAERRAAESAALRVQVLQNASSTFAASETELDLAEALAEIVRMSLAAGQACVAMLDRAGTLQVIAGVNPLDGLIEPAHAQAGPDALNLDAPIVVNATDVDGLYPHVVAGLLTAKLASVTVFPLSRDGLAMGVVAAFFGRQRELEQDALDLIAAICRQAGQSLVRIRLQDQLAHLALHDQLTGLPNRALLREELGRALASADRGGQPLAVMFLDLDGFKPVNDKLGTPTATTCCARSAAGSAPGCVRATSSAGSVAMSSSSCAKTPIARMQRSSRSACGPPWSSRTTPCPTASRSPRASGSSCCGSSRAGRRAPMTFSRSPTTRCTARRTPAATG